MEKITKIWRKFIEFMCKISKKLIQSSAFANLTLFIGFVVILVGVFGAIMGLVTTVLQSEGTDVLLTETIDSSTKEIVSAIETSGEKIVNSIEVLGTRIVSELDDKIETSNESLGEKIEASNEVLGTRIVSAIENLGRNPDQKDQESPELPEVSIGHGEVEYQNTVNEVEVYEFLIRLMNGASSAEFSVEGKPPIVYSVDSEQ